VHPAAGTGFLRGLVTRRAAAAATEIARTPAGVRKVVRVFEYISEEEASRSGGMAKEGAAAPSK
jgi:hypothetical protein